MRRREEQDSNIYYIDGKVFLCKYALCSYINEVYTSGCGLKMSMITVTKLCDNLPVASTLRTDLKVIYKDIQSRIVIKKKEEENE